MDPLIIILKFDPGIITILGRGFPFVHICNKPIMGQNEPIATSTMPIWGMDDIGWMENTYLLDSNTIVNTLIEILSFFNQRNND
jgi:hypothetical protein